MNTKQLGGLSVFALVLASCGTDVPKCDDPSVVDMVKSIVRENTEKLSSPMLAAGLQNLPQEEEAKLASLRNSLSTHLKSMPLSVEAIIVDGFNKEAGKYSCGAKLSSNLPEQLASAWKNNKMAGFMGAVVASTGNDLMADLVSPSNDIKYSVQLTADKKQMIVNVSGFDKVADAYKGAVSAAMMNQIVEIEERLKVTKQEAAMAAQADSQAKPRFDE